MLIDIYENPEIADLSKQIILLEDENHTPLRLIQILDLLNDRLLQLELKTNHLTTMPKSHMITSEREGS